MASTRVSDDEDDGLSITSSIPSEVLDDYPVERILSERRNSEGMREYLVKWEGYANHRNTWEPEGCFKSEETLVNWQETRAKIRAGKQKPYDLEAWDLSKKEYDKETEERKRRRRKKRQRLERATRAGERRQDAEADLQYTESSSLSDDQPLASTSRVQRHKRRSTKPTFMSDSDGSADDGIPLTSTSEVLKPLKNRSATVQKVDIRSSNSKPKSTSMKAKTFQASTSNNSRTDAQVQAIKSRATTKTSTPLSKTSTPKTPSVAPGVSLQRVAAPVVIAEGSGSNKAATLKASNVFANWDKPPSRKLIPDVTQLPLSDRPAKLYKKSWERKTELRGRREPVPDIKALQLMDPKTGTATKVAAVTAEAADFIVGPQDISMTNVDQDGPWTIRENELAPIGMDELGLGTPEPSRTQEERPAEVQNLVSIPYQPTSPDDSGRMEVDDGEIVEREGENASTEGLLSLLSITREATPVNSSSLKQAAPLANMTAQTTAKAMSSKPPAQEREESLSPRSRRIALTEKMGLQIVKDPVSVQENTRPEPTIDFARQQDILYGAIRKGREQKLAVTKADAAQSQMGPRLRDVMSSVFTNNQRDSSEQTLTTMPLNRVKDPTILGHILRQQDARNQAATAGRQFLRQYATPLNSTDKGRVKSNSIRSSHTIISAAVGQPFAEIKGDSTTGINVEGHLVIGSDGLFVKATFTGLTHNAKYHLLTIKEGPRDVHVRIEHMCTAQEFKDLYGNVSTSILNLDV